MSPLYRSKRRLTLAQLVPAWARELANATTSASECEGHSGITCWKTSSMHGSTARTWAWRLSDPTNEPFGCEVDFSLESWICP